MADEAESANSNEGADPTNDIKKQNPGQTPTAGDGRATADDPEKVQKLTEAGRPGFDPNGGSD